MTEEQFNEVCAALPATTSVVQWGGCQVWKVGEKVFAIGAFTENGPAYTFKVTRGDFEALQDMPGLRPAPYLASRGMSWIQNYAAPGLPDDVLADYLKESHKLVSAGLSKRRRLELGLET